MRHAEVALDLGRSRSRGSFTYQVPDHMPVRPGDLVLVPLSKRVLPGVVVSVAGSAPDFPTRPVEERLADDPFLGPLQLTLARWISAHYRAPLFDCLALFLPPGLAARLARAARAGQWKPPHPRTEAREVAPRPAERMRATPRASVLTLPQQVAAARIIAALDARQHVAFLLHGVTGSGKTHVYLDAVERTLELNRQAIVLISEIALTPETLGRFEQRFPGRTALIHSRLTVVEHRRAWERVRRGEAEVIVGSRSALFAPVRRPGLVILDEEHEWTYKQEMSPRYHAREVALWWGQLAKAPVVLGSATPDVDSFYRAERNRYVLLRLPTRYPRGEVDSSPGPSPTRRGESISPLRAGEGPGEGFAVARPLPAVTVVDMRRELRAGNAGIFSRELADALAAVLDRGEQALLFLNRRGSATCVTCRDCGHVMACRRCDIPLVFHRADEVLVCHRCNRRQISPERCPSCGGPRIRYLGVGTQRVEQELRASFPKARVERWDHDVTARRGAHERLWRALGAGEVDVMIGTQMIAKALDFPRVTLVGVVLADVGLFLPDFRAGERAFQLLTQMAGRTGRGPRGGRAIVQTYSPDHYAIRAAARHDYETFYRREIAFRRAHGYPPVGRLVRLVYSGSGEERCVREAARVRGVLEAELGRRGIGDIHLLGPAPCFYHRVRNRERWQIVLRGDRFARLLDHVELPPGWTVDVDPMSLL